MYVCILGLEMCYFYLKILHAFRDRTQPGPLRKLGNIKHPLRTSVAYADVEQFLVKLPALSCSGQTTT